MKTQSRLLVTFGCSWTFGVGVQYQPGMTKKQYKAIVHREDSAGLTFRRRLAANYQCAEHNHAVMGSSNQQQFRLAKEFFSPDQVEKLKKQFSTITVLWGITSTARSEYFDASSNLFEPIYSGDSTPPAKSWIANYNHEHEVQQLSVAITYWDEYFRNHGMQNFWFDTFNHHNYQVDILKNFIYNNKQPRDLLSQMLIQHGHAVPDSKYHLSNWSLDTARLDALVDLQLVNPLSFHPTQLGHEMLYTMLKNEIGEYLK